MWRKEAVINTPIIIPKLIKYGLFVPFKVAIARLKIAEKPSKESCHIAELVSCKKTARNTRVGTSLLEYGLRKTSNLGLSKYTLHVEIGNHTALKLYQKVGFKIIEKQRRRLLPRLILGSTSWYHMEQNYLISKKSNVLD